MVEWPPTVERESSAEAFLERERLQAERKGEIELVAKVDGDKWGDFYGYLACFFFARNL